jgi:hypothetical protein
MPEQYLPHVFDIFPTRSTHDRICNENNSSKIQAIEFGIDERTLKSLITHLD